MMKSFDYDAWALASKIVSCKRCIKILFSEKVDNLTAVELKKLLHDSHEQHLKEAGEYWKRFASRYEHQWNALARSTADDAIPKFDALAAGDHLGRHILLHHALDELLADFMHHIGRTPTQTTVMELLGWSHTQTRNPTEKKKE